MSWHEDVIAQSYLPQNALSSQSTCTLLRVSVWHKTDHCSGSCMLFPSGPAFWCSQLILSSSPSVLFLSGTRTLKPKLTALCIMPCLIRGWNDQHDHLNYSHVSQRLWDVLSPLQFISTAYIVDSELDTRPGVVVTAIPRAVITPLLLSISLSAAETLSSPSVCQHILRSADFPHALCQRMDVFLAPWHIILPQAMLIEWAIC